MRLRNPPTGRREIAVFYYQYADTYISTVRAAFNDIAAKDDNVEILEYDGQNNQRPRTTRSITRSPKASISDGQHR